MDTSYRSSEDEPHVGLEDVYATHPSYGKVYGGNRRTLGNRPTVANPRVDVVCGVVTSAPNRGRTK
jgi:hypothetical protein